MNDINQFYPTPSTLAYQLFGLFKNKKITRLLEPSAGRGDLIKACEKHVKKENVDCIEIDFNNQSILREKGYNVIDSDFLQSDVIGMYSHIMLNPPFNNGIDHVLKAWNILYSGELVAILNAESVRNNTSQKYDFLRKLIENYGSVEFIQSAFTTPETLRKTDVEVALIWLKKDVDLKQSFTHGLELDTNVAPEIKGKQELAIPSNTIDNAVLVFNCAVNAMKTAELAQEEAYYYSNLLGQSLNKEKREIDADISDFQTRYNARYKSLKEQAWSNVLKSTEFSKYLSAKSYQKLVKEFEQVSKLNFTGNNIRGFLLGLVQGQGDMNMEMLLDCFDEITKYKTDNRSYYCGWKSNDKHTTNAYKVKMTRFIIPTYGWSWDSYIPFDFKNKLNDFDKVFAMLDGKPAPEKPLAETAEKNWDELKKADKISTSYFDIRYYKGKKTMHFYPTRKDLIDRLNRLVGKERAWLPDEKVNVHPEFWKQFDDSDKITSKMVIKDTWEYRDKFDENISKEHDRVCDELGYDKNKFFMLT